MSTLPYANKMRVDQFAHDKRCIAAWLEDCGLTPLTAHDVMLRLDMKLSRQVMFEIDLFQESPT